jgi:TetR/AcrR family transcriptional repressor of nem operon
MTKAAAAGSTAEQILHSARRLIIAGGYNGFSYDDIATEVGIRKASIHHHFPAKAVLVRKVVELYRAEVEAGIAGLERQITDPIEQLRAYVGFWETCIRDATAPYCVCALLAVEIPVLPDDIAREVRGHFRSLSAWLTSVFERGRSLGRFQLAGAPRAEAEAFMATVHGAMLSARAYGDAEAFGVITRPLLARLVPAG